MTRLTRKSVLLGLSAAALPLNAGCATAPDGLARVNPRWVVSEEEATAWHAVKDELGPALTGTPSWRQFLQFLEAKLNEYGCVDVHRSAWRFTRMQSSVWPDDSGWSLTVDGRSVPLSNYGANCGLTAAEGVTAPLVLWDADEPPDVAGKIVVYRPVPRSDVRAAFATSDFERATPYDSYPEEGLPTPQSHGALPSISPAVWDDMTASADFVRAIKEAGPAGVVFALNLNRAAAAGLYTFRVPDHYDFPSVYVDRVNGDALIEHARMGRNATIRVEGERLQSEAYQLIAYLPGRHYGAAGDEQIQLRTHTDGPSISQDNGAFGLLGLIKYMSRVPRHNRPRTLFVELDCRHFLPGAEATWRHEDYFEKNPVARERVVALVAMEHLGQIEYVEAGEEIVPSGRSLATWIYSSGDENMIDVAHTAALDNDVRAAMIRSPGRPGARGEDQGPWYGMSRQGAMLGLPTYGVQGDLGAYWAFSGRINRFDARAFTRQVAMFVQITTFLMTADLTALEISPAQGVTPGGAH